ncbi:MAG: hypothetical protein IJR63_02615 [Synergistaceae bacterium]|nr:hypothetical protein [Synergistaceae bacterium]
MRAKKFFLALLLLLASVKSEASSFMEELLSLEGVVSVDVIAQETPVFSGKYIAWFEQPLDWSSPDAGTFLQRVEIGFSGWENLNVVYLSGYDLSESTWPYDDRNEIAKIYNGNYIRIEYRYFGKSVPDGLSDKSTALWEHLSNTNASSDFHNIMEQLRTILPGAWVFTGSSKGGQAANIFAYYYPNDADAYVSYVAPFCDGADDPRMSEAVYTVIGNERYGPEKAQEYRDLLLSFQLEAVRNREYLQPLITANDPRGYVTDEHKAAVYFELSVIDFPVTVWQYYQNFDGIKAVLNMPRENIADKKKYLDTVAGMITEEGPVYSSFAYTVQAAKENGNYRPCVKYLREAAEREGLHLEIGGDEESYIWNKISFTEEQMRLFEFDPYMRDEIIAWSHTTESNVIMIYGNSDPWYFVRLPDVADNPNVHIFTSEHSHLVSINSMSQEKRDEILSLLDSWLEQDRSSVQNPGSLSSSGGGCNLAGNLGIILLSVIASMRKRTVTKIYSADIAFVPPKIM